MGIENRIRDWLESQLTNTDIFLLDVKKAGNKLLILIDGDTAVPIKKCVEISRLTASWLEEQDIIQDAFTLEVSSPGADSPLILPRQFPKHIGRLIEVHMKDDHRAEGVLREADETGLTIDEKIKVKGKAAINQHRRLELQEIDEIKVKIDFKGSKP